MISSMLRKTSSCMLVYLNLSAGLQACLKVVCDLHNISRPVWYVLSEFPKMKEVIPVFVSTSRLNESGVAAEGYLSYWSYLVEQNATTLSNFLFSVLFACFLRNIPTIPTKNINSYNNMKWVYVAFSSLIPWDQDIWQSVLHAK